MHLDVKVDEDTVWLNRKQLALLFGRDIKTIGKHVGNALREELNGFSVVAEFGNATVRPKESSQDSTRRSKAKNGTVPPPQEKAANLLYQVVKDHPFSDGNKRCAAALFVYFLNGNSILGDDDSPACGG